METPQDTEIVQPSKSNLFGRISKLNLLVKILLVGVPLLAIVVVVIALVIPKPDDIYLGKLREAKLGGFYASDAAALAKAKAVCDDLASGGKNQGVQAEAIAVEIYCPDFLSGFRTIKPINVVGTMTISDYSPSSYFPVITNIGSWCWGNNGYSDIDEGTKVVITNQDGKRLAETALEEGSGSAYSCEFDFKFKVMEGETEYLVAVGKRGEISYTESELKLPGRVAIFLN